MALLATTLMLLAIIVLAMIAMCRDPWNATDQRPKPARRPISPVPASYVAPGAIAPPARHLTKSLLHEQLVLYQVDGRAADTDLPRCFTVLAKNAGAAMVKARRWGMKIDAIRRVDRRVDR